MNQVIALLLMATMPAVALSSWRPMGPFGGSAEVVRVIPGKKDQVLAGTGNGLLFLSRNGGASWTNIPFPAQSAGMLHAIAIDPHASNAWYVGMEGNNLHISGIYRTNDGGISWTLLPATKGLAVWSLAFDSSQAGVMAAGTGSGVYLSKDSGATWKLISRPDDPELKPVVSLAFDPRDDRVIYAGTTHLPWRTTDGGSTWQSIHSGMIDDSDVFSIEVDPNRPSRVLASACSGAYSSSDGANRWKRLNTPKGAFRTYFIALDPGHAGTIFAGTSEGLIKSTNDGATWRLTSRVPVKSISFDPFVRGRIFFASAADGLLLSTDGGETLRESNAGFTNRTFTSVTATGITMYVSGVSELFGTTTLGLRWDGLGPLPGRDELLVIAAAPDTPKTLFGAGYHGLFESVDGGKSWRPRRGLPEGSRVRSIVANPGGVVLAGTDRGLFRSWKADAWTRVSASPVEWMQAQSARNITAVNGESAMLSNDAGKTWRACGALPAGVRWYGLAVDPSSPGVALAATSKGLYRSIDGCQTWTAATSGLEQATAEAVLFHPTRAGEAFVAEAGRVFRSTDEGRTWRPLDTEGRFWPSSFLIPASAPDRLFALVPGRGVFSITASAASAVAQHGSYN